MLSLGTKVRVMGMTMEFRELLQSSITRTIQREIDPYLEASEVSADDQNTPWVAPAKGHKGFRLAGNAISTRDSMAKALGVDVDAIPDTILTAMEGPTQYETIEMPAYYQEVAVEDIPFPTYYRSDGGPYVTSGIFHAGIDDRFNLSFHRMMYLGGDKFAIRVVPRHLNALLKEAEKKGKQLQAVVSMGTDPAALLAGSISLPFGEDEMKVASALHNKANGSPIQLFSPVNDPDGAKAPKGTEVVLYGKFTDEKVPEGPFVDITSTVDLSGMDPGEPVFQVDKALIRNDPMVHVLLPGGFEHYMMMGLPKEPAIIRSVRKTVPLVHGVRLTEGGCCWLHGVVSITKQEEDDGKKAIAAAFKGHPSMKRVIVVDQDVDIFNDIEVEWALSTRFQANRDMVILENVRGSTLDPSANPKDHTTSKMGMDATMPLKGRDPYLKVN